MKRTATLSDCGRFRFTLTREWDRLLPQVMIIMLNPSTADADRDDPTITKCIGFAKRLGLGGFVVCNLFAYRATKPADLRRAGYERHPQEDSELLDALPQVDGILCAWGANARGLARPAEVLEMVTKGRRLLTPRALAFTSGGEPAHPLMLSYSLVPDDKRSVLGCCFDALPAVVR